MPSKAEICVGHAIGYINGESVLKKGDGFDGTKNYKYSEAVLDGIMDIDFSVGSYFKTFQAKNIEGHATLICVLVHEGRALAWYYNPWGMEADLDLHEKEEYDKIREISPYTEKALYFFPRKLSTWAKGLPKSHIMYTLKSMQELSRYSIEVINPIDSLVDYGPQDHRDGVENVEWIKNMKETMKSCDKEVGSCAVWTVMYSTLMKEIVSGLLAENKPIDHINRIITPNMKKGIISLLNPMESIGIVTYAETIYTEEKELLLTIFELLPEVYDILSDPGSMESTYHRRLRNSHKRTSLQMRPSLHKGYITRNKQHTYASEVIGPLLLDFLENVILGNHDDVIHDIVRIFTNKISLKPLSEQDSDTVDFLNQIMTIVYCKTSREFTGFDTSTKPHNTRGRKFTHKIQDVIKKKR